MNGYCVPFALAFISGKTTDEVAAMIREERGDGGPVRRVHPRHYLAILPALGFKITARVRRPGMTIRKWAANRAKWGDKSTWLVRKAGHIMVYRDGMIYDNSHCHATPDKHPHGTARVYEAIQIGATA
jgi:hypothetical protein